MTSIEIERSAVERFRGAVRGEVLRPGDQGYDETRTAWNGLIDNHPAVVVRCMGTADVMAAVDFAREQNLPVAVEGGGHHIAGHAVCDDTLVWLFDNSETDSATAATDTPASPDDADESRSPDSAVESGTQDEGGEHVDTTDTARRPLHSTFAHTVLDEASETVFWNEAHPDTTGYSHEEIASMHSMHLIPEDQHEFVPSLMEPIDNIEDRRVDVDILTKDGDCITHEFMGTSFEDRVSGDTFRCGIARDVTDQRACERTLERQRDELASLDRINEFLLDTVRELAESASREAVEQTVCDRLAESDLYRFAWVGEPEFDGDRIVPRTVAGEDDRYVDAITVTSDDAPTGTGSAGRAYRTGDVQVVTVDDPSFAPWCDGARERGVVAVAAVPIQHGGTVYGVLVVYATREDAFTASEQAGFDVLGRTVGTVVHGARSRNLLFADEMVELEFRLDGGTDSAFVRTARAHDCTLSLDGYVATDDRWVVYAVLVDAAPGDVIATISDDPTVDRARVVDSGDTDHEVNGCIEFVLTDSSLLHTVTDAGATLEAATATPSGATIVVETPADGDVRAVVDHVRRAYPTADLRARRERDHPVTADSVGRPDGLLDGLTDRQREVLEAAYRAGYFEWPRESTAEEVAASLDLASPTLHGHLRKAERALLSALFSPERPTDGADSR